MQKGLFVNMWRLEDNEKWSHLVQSSTPVPLEDAEIVPIPEKRPSREEWEETYVFIRKISDDRFLAVKLTDIIRRSKQMIEWINPEDRLPEEYHPVLVKIGWDVHVAHIVEKISLTGPGKNFWFADDTIMIWPAEDASCWAEIPNVQKDTNSAESKPEEPHTFDYNSAMMWLMLIMVLGSMGNCKVEPKSGWFYKDSGKEYKGAIYTGKDMFADKDGNEIIYIPPSKR